MIKIPRKWEVTFYRGIDNPTVKFILYDDFLNNIIHKVGDIHVEDAIQVEIREIALPKVQLTTTFDGLAEQFPGIQPPGTPPAKGK